MFRLLTSPRLVWSTAKRYNSTSEAAKKPFDMYNLATSSINRRPSKLNNAYLDSQANKKPYNARSGNIVSRNAFEEDPKLFLQELPRTGTGMGTSVEVRDGNVKSALSQLARQLRVDQVREIKYKQRYHMKPSKVKGEEKTQKRKKWFHAGLKELFKSVKDARRRGY